ncbi:MAG: hypothetical protein M1839_002966 [Geoglossum umbratile]|nr:MAG: hypothetical protein M1839_002966 [Geoglossum umbratile]
MLMEADDYNDQMTDQQDVAIIAPQHLDDDVLEEHEPLADDYEAMRLVALPINPDLEIEAETVFTWHIQDWRNLQRREHGPDMTCGGYPWRILFFPYGNNVEHASFYLEQGFGDEKPPEDWYACVQFALVLWNPNDPSIYTTHNANHRFTMEEGDWGFTRFAEIRKLFHGLWEDKSRPMVENDAVNMSAYIRIVKDPTGVLWHNFINYDSKKVTGYVGLKNQGATCYLNSLLQSLYFTNAFRKAIYQIPTENEDSHSNSAYTLQRLFYQLQTSNDAVSTSELTRSFGWETKHIFEQQDVQELSRKLMERMEEKMKDTDAENALAKLFVGRTKTYVSCINVDYESSRVEDFWDIQLNVSGNKNLDESFKDYIQVETMDGENKYFAEGYGLQDAKKGVIFESFPQVLHLQLKRFEYDINRDAMMKVNDRYEFPEIFDATPYLSEDADKSEPYIYQLHGVLVHSGDFNAGHYYAFLKPTKDGLFYKFDDDRVTRATMKEVLEENFGGDYNMPNGHTVQGVRNPYTRTLSTKRSMSAYMLVYLRQTRLDSILPEVSKDDTPPHLQRKLDEERAYREQKRKERDEAHLYLPVKVITEENFKTYQGFDLTAWDVDLADPAAPRSYRTLRTMTIGELTGKIAEDIGKEADHLRLWVMVNRQNKTVRPDQPLVDSLMTIEDAHAKFGTKGHEFRIWIEEASKFEGGKPVWPEIQHQLNSNSQILIFAKYFDAEAQTLKGAGYFYMRKHDKVTELASPILQLMGWSTGLSLKLYEEIKPAMIEPLKQKQSLNQAEIQDGDIICFQKALKSDELVYPASRKDVSLTLFEYRCNALAQAGKYVDAREIYDHLLNRIMVRFCPKIQRTDEDQTFTLELSKKMTYDQFASRVGEHLGVDPTHLRFTTVNQTTGNPKMVVKRNLCQNVAQILSPQFNQYSTTQLSNQLYFEVLELSLSELETKKNLKIIWLSEGITKEETFEVLVAKNGIVADILSALQKKAKFDDTTIRQVRLYEAHGGKVYKELSSDHSVVGVGEYVQLYAEKIPDEELKAEEGDKFINAFHFQKEPNKSHGTPFKFLVKPGEPFKDTKARLEKRTGIKGKQFEKIKFAVVQRISYSRPIYLADDEILYDVASEFDDLLGLDHTDRSRGFWGRGDSIFIR